MKRTIVILAAILTLTVSVESRAQRPEPLPDNLTERAVTIWSEGARMAGDVYKPKDAGDELLPAIVMSHGWGGTKANLRRNAIRFAGHGFVVLAFDYRGWGESDSLMTIVGNEQPLTGTGEIDVRVNLARNIVDPFAHLVDIRRAFDWIEGEPNVDTDRIGYWGSSYSGGHAVWLAANEARVKCAVAQVPAANSRSIPEVLFEDLGILETTKNRATARARGDIDPFPGKDDKAPKLTGWAVLDHVLQYNPVDDADKIKIPLLVIDAENEELYDRHTAGKLSAEKAKANGADAVYYVVEGITHYGVYTTRYEEVTKLAEEWFVKHLK